MTATRVASASGSAEVPAPTKAALVATVAVAAVALAVFSGPAAEGAVDARTAAWFLLLFTVLFVVRVVGQVAVVLWAPRWLAPMHHWNLMPYRLLLPIQLVFVAVMAWLVHDFLQRGGVLVTPRPGFGEGVRWFSYAYAAGMAIRYAVRMGRRAEQRWFGGTIPIAFHFVLAAFLYVFGTYHASH